MQSHAALLSQQKSELTLLRWSGAVALPCQLSAVANGCELANWYATHHAHVSEAINLKAHRRVYHSTQSSRAFLGPVSRVTKKKKRTDDARSVRFVFDMQPRPAVHTPVVSDLHRLLERVHLRTKNIRAYLGPVS